MAAHLPLFSLRLGVGRTIGHQTLHTIWLRASRSADVTVSRARGFGRAHHPDAAELSRPAPNPRGVAIAAAKAP